jgi:hypothetical protein
VLVIADSFRTRTCHQSPGSWRACGPVGSGTFGSGSRPTTLLYGRASGGCSRYHFAPHEVDEHPHAGCGGHLTAIRGTAPGLGGSSAGFEYGLKLLALGDELPSSRPPVWCARWWA